MRGFKNFFAEELSKIVTGLPSCLSFINKPTWFFYAPPQKVEGYYVIPSEFLSVSPSVRQRLIIRVRSITLIPFKIISRNLAQVLSMTR